MAGRVFDPNGISPCVMERHSKVVQVAVKKFLVTYHCSHVNKETQHSRFQILV